MVLLILGNREPAIGHCLPVILPGISVVCRSKPVFQANNQHGMAGFQ